MSMLTREFVESALKAQSIWDFSNAMLYNLCKDFPDHTKQDVIIAKTIIIGRVYVAQLERRREVEKISSDVFYITLARAILHSPVDQWLRDLKGDLVTQPQAPIETHKTLTDFLQPITGMENRSFASKYLHFHRLDLFFIYDARASESARKLSRLKRGERALVARPDVDAEYAEFSLRCTRLTERIRVLIGRIPSPREVDKVLLHWHANKNNADEAARAIRAGQ